MLVRCPVSEHKPGLFACFGGESNGQKRKQGVVKINKELKMKVTAPDTCTLILASTRVTGAVALGSRVYVSLMTLWDLVYRMRYRDSWFR